jgi:hypothetical protein
MFYIILSVKDNKTINQLTFLALYHLKMTKEVETHIGFKKKISDSQNTAVLMVIR